MVYSPNLTRFVLERNTPTLIKFMKSLFLLFVCLFPILPFAQKQASFTSIVDQLNNDLVQYEKLFAHGDEYLPINRFDLSKKEMKALIKESDCDAILTNSKDSINQYYMIVYFQERILDQLQLLLNHPDFGKNDIAKMIHDELSVVKSADNKLYNFSLDEKSEGSYRSRFSYMHFTDLKPQDSSEVDPYKIFEGDGYSELFMLNTDEGVKYVLTGNVRGCSSCFETFVQLVSFKDNAFNLDFEYAVNNRGW